MGVRWDLTFFYMVKIFTVLRFRYSAFPRQVELVATTTILITPPRGCSQAFGPRLCRTWI